MSRLGSRRTTGGLEKKDDGLQHSLHSDTDVARNCAIYTYSECQQFKSFVEYWRLTEGCSRYLSLHPFWSCSEEKSEHERDEVCWMQSSGLVRQSGSGVLT